MAAKILPAKLNQVKREGNDKKSKDEIQCDQTI